MREKTLQGLTAALIFSFFICLSLTPAAATAEIKLGILPRLSAMEMNTMFSPLADHLSKEVGEKVTLVIPKDFDAFKDMIKSEQVDLGFANPLVYVQLKKDKNLEPIALAAEPKWGTRFRGIVIVRKDGGIDKLQGLKGKKLIFVDKSSAVYLTGMLLLSKAGFDLSRDFTMLPFAKKVDNVTMAVFNKAADGGVIREDDLDKMKDKVDVSQLKIIGYTEYVPNWPVFSLPKADNAGITKIKAALLKLKPNGAKSEEILGPAKLTGFTSVSDRDFEQLRQAAKLAETM